MLSKVSGGTRSANLTGNADARRAGVKRALDIIIHLQARLRMDIGGSPAQALGTRELLMSLTA